MGGRVRTRGEGIRSGQRDAVDDVPEPRLCGGQAVRARSLLRAVLHVQGVRCGLLHVPGQPLRGERALQPPISPLSHPYLAPTSPISHRLSDPSPGQVEFKYTSIVPLGRAVLPRVDMAPLATYLNNVEQVKRSQRESTTLAVTITDKYYWHCDSVTDSGPILRLESKTKNLKKAERYVHPYERPIYPSLIEASEMQPLVISYLAHAYAHATPKMEWSNEDLQQFANSIDWLPWEKKVAEIKFQPPR